MFYRHCIWYVSSILFLFLYSSGFSQQYNVFLWENFETGQFPESLATYGRGSEENVLVAEYANLSGFPGVLEGIAKTECRSRGLYFKTTPAGRYLRVVSAHQMNRLALSESASAIVQADFFIHELSGNMLGFALLAAQINPQTPSVVDRFYRLGINNLGEIYFSRYDSQIEEHTVNYARDKVNAYQLKVPGWHRFQMVFRGQEKIFCYIDGQETAFSPVSDPTLTSLQMGVMVASSLKESHHDCIIDNLSIQMAEEEVPLPRSPWKQIYSQTIQNPLYVDNHPASGERQGDLKWFTTADEAVQYNLGKKIPYLVLFYSPFARANAPLEQILLNDAEARAFLTRFILVSVDVNQLGGGSLAKQMSVYKSPTFLLLSFEGNEISRATYGKDMTWRELQNALQPGLN
ncbi:hypothetical protein JW926_05135 [Candidatus Sumerlaeota bacterium]|nr:hypothetical protein [Candidatus Sumerlaeota bacterium]